ncbi:MAG: PAS domain-containing sensor histidine kinase [Desulfovibrio sp.]|nr:PAS domain-containing sensor histidine kinase [Desulfovibrio sp.]
MPAKDTPAGTTDCRVQNNLLDLLIDQLDGEIFILNEDGLCLSSGPKILEGLDKNAEELDGLRQKDLDQERLHCSENAENCPIRVARESGKKAERVCTLVQEDGEVRYINAFCCPFPNPSGKERRYIYIRRDVTEREHMQIYNRQTEKMAALGELSNYMAHEIRNPLFSIGGFANALLRNSSLNDLAREKASIIYDEAKRLDYIITGILNFARPTEQTLTDFAAETVAQQTFELRTLGCEGRGINVILDIEKNLPRAEGNVENFKQSLVNIIKNSLEAMPEGGILTLVVKRAEPFVQIDVIDTGAGMDADLQKQVFNPFFSTKNVAAGLGLAMSRKVIKEMGGDLVLESHKGRGTRVSITLPMALHASQAKHEGEHA